jgi:hypothetical protein
MREKLIELLTETFDEQYEKRMLITPQHTAEFLLANGVVVLPCKPRDTVYTIEGKRIYEDYITDYCIGESYEHWGMLIDRGRTSMVINIRREDFGRKVFLTKEEAEAKLKEGKG